MDQFVFFWMNKNLDMGNESPNELQQSIKKYTKHIEDNINDPTIQKCLTDYQDSLKKHENYHDNFWVGDHDKNAKKQYIHYSSEYSKVRKLLNTHDNILIFAGAGMSADSGLPVFRKARKTLFTPDFSNTQEIIDMFNAHVPHDGYKTLLKYCKNKDYYVMTTNIDGYFDRVGFIKDRIVEVHGNVYYSQCRNKCHDNVYNYIVSVCPFCKENLRPNVMLFGDREYINKTNHIDKNMSKWISEKINNNENILIIEIGAGIHIPTIRDYSELLVQKHIGLIRVNPEYWEVPDELLKIRREHQLLVGRVPLSAIDFFNVFIDK